MRSLNFKNKGLYLLLLSCLFFAKHSNAESLKKTSNSHIHQLYNDIHLENKLSFDAFKKGYLAYEATSQKKKEYLTIVDYSMPSTEKRFFVIDMKTHRLIYRTLVAQGKNTGQLEATHFSNQQGTKESSLGTFITANPYHGIVGFGLRIIGLTKGKNTNAYDRDIVVHGADYVSQSFINDHGYLGHSWGCLALPLNSYKNIINTIKDGSVIYSYS